MEMNETKEMSLSEKVLCRKVLGDMAELPYPQKQVMCADGVAQMEYEIPDEARAAVMDQLYFLEPMPGLGDRMFDIHECRAFLMREFKVIRWRGTNILVSPYHAQSGGTIVDMVPDSQRLTGLSMLAIRAEFAQGMHERMKRQ